MENASIAVKETSFRDGVQIARAALAEITAADSVGEPCGVEVHEDGTQTQLFTCLLPGYPGWRWAAALAQVGDAAPTVLEVELLAGPDSVVAPEWVPWSVRLAQFREAQARQAADEAAAAEAAAAEIGDADELDAEEELLDNDFSDFDDEIDGVELEEEAEDAAEFDEFALLAALDEKSAEKHRRVREAQQAQEMDDDSALMEDAD